MGSYVEDVYQALYEQILDGTLKPGEKLHIAKLAEMFGVGLSPVREALSRLIGTHFITALSQRGFIVTSLSLDDMQDIYATRTYIEKIALALSIENGNADWEANLLAAYHRLSQVEKKTAVDTIEAYKNWEKYHRDFNKALIAACGLKHLLLMQENIYQQTERYRRLWFLAGLKEDKILKFSIKQKAIMDAAIDHNIQKATHLLEEHFESAKKHISEFLQ